MASGVLLGLGLSSPLFVIHINDLHDNVVDMVSTYSDATKIGSLEKSEEGI